MSKLKFCPVCGREHSYNTEMCAKHYRQWKEYGKCLDNNPRNQYDPNEIRVKDGYGEIDTYDVDCNVNCTYKFDLEDIHFLQGKKWRTSYKRGIPYLCAGHTVYFHRLVCQTDKTVDHINRDTTDNRKLNLRPADDSLQQVNQNVQKTNTTGFTGVFYHKNHKVWHAELSYNKKRYFGPTVLTKEEAIYTRMCLEKRFLKTLLRPIDDYAPYVMNIPKERRLNLIKFIKNKFK